METESIKMKKPEMKNMITEMKTTSQGINNRLEKDDKVSNLEDKATENIQSDSKKNDTVYREA